MFLEDKTIEDRKQQKLEQTSQLTPTIVDSSSVDHTMSTKRRQPVGIAESEMVDSEQSTNTYELESTDLQKSIDAYTLELVDCQEPIDMHKPEPNEESTDTSEHEPTMGSGRYQLRQRRAP